MRRFFTKHGLLVLSAAAAVMVILSLVTYFSNNTGALTNVVNVVASPFRSLSARVSGWIDGQIRFAADYDALEEENAELKIQVAKLEEELRQVCAQIPWTIVRPAFIYGPFNYAPREAWYIRLLSLMQPGTVLVDVAIDQGGCFETSHPTTHSEPTYLVDGIVHYAVANIPGAVPFTSTMALTNATLPYTLALADKGWQKACQDDEALALGVNIAAGKVTYKAVADVFGY